MAILCRHNNYFRTIVKNLVLNALEGYYLFSFDSSRIKAPYICAAFSLDGSFVFLRGEYVQNAITTHWAIMGSER